MASKRNDNIEKTVQVLMQLDEKNLLLIDSGAKLLLSRQNMDKESENIRQLAEA